MTEVDTGPDRMVQLVMLARWRVWGLPRISTRQLSRLERLTSCPVTFSPSRMTVSPVTSLRLKPLVTLWVWLGVSTLSSDKVILATSGSLATTFCFRFLKPNFFLGFTRSWRL